MNVSNEKADERATLAGERKIEKRPWNYWECWRGWNGENAGECKTARRLARVKRWECWRGWNGENAGEYKTARRLARVKRWECWRVQNGEKAGEGETIYICRVLGKADGVETVKHWLRTVWDSWWRWQWTLDVSKQAGKCVGCCLVGWLIGFKRWLRRLARAAVRLWWWWDRYV